MKNKVYRLLLFVIFCLLQQFSFAQIERELNLNPKKLNAYDSLINSIRVPEIDPRQYMIIYEWNESNENKSRKAIRDEFKLKEVERYSHLINEKLKELQFQKREIDKELIPLKQKFKYELNRLDSLYTLERNEPDTYQDTYSIEVLLGQLDRKREQLESRKSEIERKIANATTLKKRFNYQGDYVKWQYTTEKDSTTFDKFKPFDFFEEIGKDYSGLQKAYEEYYNDIVWRNAGTPDWEPIWWLNQYPWPNTAFRNIDLIDQNYRDNRFALIPYQKYEVIDYKATLRLVFDKNQLARNEAFKGSIGLDAFLYDGSEEGGDPREIEINPYSVIGKERKSIGLLNRPAGELADHLIVLIKKAADISEDKYSFNSLYGKTITDLKENIISDLDIYIKATESLTKDNYTTRERNRIQKSIETLCEDISYLGNIGLNYSCIKIKFTDIFNEEKRNNKDTLIINTAAKTNTINVLKTLKVKLEASKKQDAIDNFNIVLREMRSEIEDIQLIVKYLDYFNEEVGNTRDAFLSLIGKDKITFEYLVDKIKHNTDSVHTILSNIHDAVKSDAMESQRYSNENQKLYDYSSKIYVLLRSLANFNGSHLDDVVQKIWKLDQKPSEIDSIDYYSEDAVNYSEDDSNIKRDWENLRTIYADSKKRKQLREYIAEKAGEILYQDLVYGTIDLDKADARDGDYLYISMYWDKEAVKSKDTGASSNETSSNKDNTSPQKDGVALYVAKFKLTKRGWTFQTSDNAMLVDRYREDLLRSNYPLNSNNFKLTGGAAMTWGLRNDHRINKKIKFDPNTNLPKFNKDGRLKYNKPSVIAQKTFKWLEPSFGINFSYLDFNTTRNFELGVGPSLGLFNNTLYLSTGWNLMEFRERSLYFGIGASFVNLGTKVTKTPPTP